MSPANGSILSVEDLRTGFGAHAVLHGVTFAVQQGEIAAILGLNGAGKSVTLKTVSGLIEAWEGKIRLQGEDVTDLETEDRVARGMAHVLQGRAVFPHLSVEENLRLGGAVVKDKTQLKSNFDRIYSTFPRLAERKDQLGGTLSGGEQEMLAVGRALMSSPKILLVDEASQGLAPSAVQHLFETLSTVNATGVTLLMVEQNVTFTLGIAHRVFVMQKGQIVYEGASDALDRDRLAGLLGIGALLRKRTLKEEPEGPRAAPDSAPQVIAKSKPRRVARKKVTTKRASPAKAKTKAKAKAAAPRKSKSPGKPRAVKKSTAKKTTKPKARSKSTVKPKKKTAR